jgi:hypothetical protein
MSEEALIAELGELLKQPYLMDCWICYVAPAGRAVAYPRVQSRRPQFKGKKVLHLGRYKSVADYQARIDRGRRIKKIQTQLQKYAKPLNQV